MREPESTRSQALEALNLQALKLEFRSSDARIAPASRLQSPLREVTRLGVDEWTVRRMWDGIQRRSSTASSSPVGTGGESSRRSWLWVGRVPSWGIALVLALLVGASWLGLRPYPGSSETAGAPLAAAPLLLEGGLHFDHLEAAPGVSERASFADGSSIEAAPGTRVEGLAATGSEFVVLVRRGKARFAVTPGGPRRWLIETRSARVEVVGTVLSVESAEGFVAVKVEEGVVLVRSPLLRDGVQRVAAGQSLQLDAAREGVEAVSPEPAAVLPEAAPIVTPESLPRLAPERGRVRSRSAAAKNRSAERSSGRSEPRADAMTAAELWAGADGARQAGDAARAARLLERLLYEHPGDSQAALGAYTLARLQLDQLGRPRAAAERFAQALDLGLAAPLRESCYVRWVEALRQAGESAALREVAADYLKQYPQGAQRQAMQRLLDAKPSVAGAP